MKHIQILDIKNEIGIIWVHLDKRLHNLQDQIGFLRRIHIHSL